jgi:hypothetical protein
MIRHFPQHASSNASGDARDVGEGIAKTISSRGPAVSKLWLWSVTVLGTLLVWPFVSLILLGLLFSDASGSGDWDWLAVILGLIVSGAAIGGAVLGVERLRRWESARLARKFKPEIDELERRYTWQCGQILQKYPDLLKAIGSMDKLHDTRTVTYWAIRHIGYRPWTARQEQAMKEAREMHDQQRIEKLISQNPCLRYL